MKCLLIAYTAQNLGDDMFVDYICRRYPNIDFIIVSPPEYSLAFFAIPNLTVLHANSELVHLKDSIRIQVLIGGSLFMEPKNPKDIYSKYVFNTEYRAFKDIPFVVIGANFGPYKSQIHLSLHQESALLSETGVNHA